MSPLQLHKNKILIYLILKGKEGRRGKIGWCYAMFSIIYLCLYIIYASMYIYIMLPCILCYLPLLYMLVALCFHPYGRRQHNWTVVIALGKVTSGKNGISLRACGCIFIDFTWILTYLMSHQASFTFWASKSTESEDIWDFFVTKRRHDEFWKISHFQTILLKEKC